MGEAGGGGVGRMQPPRSGDSSRAHVCDWLTAAASGGGGK